MEAVSHPISPCRSCARDGLELIVDLGRMPLANGLLDEGQLAHPEPTYPLQLAYCPHCTLVQILETLPPEKLFRAYVYFSSVSETMLAHAHRLAGDLIALRRLGAASLVVEAASNDGYLLQFYREAGVPVLGIEPAHNIARLAREQRGIPTREEFFTEDLARQLAAEGLQADIFHAHNVLAHVADLNGFVRGICRILRDDGLAVVEVPYVKPLLDHCEFDTIYHEHLCYFSVTALESCFRRNGLHIVDVTQLPIHGGSLRVLAVPTLSNPAPSDRVAVMLQDEQAWGVARPEVYCAFARRVEGLRGQLRSLLGDLKKQGKRLAGYGASAKGSTLLNYCGIGRETLDFIVDRSPVKQGRFTPGTHLRIHDPGKLLEEMPDYALLLTWNFGEEIMHQQAEYLRRGGCFITPVPQVRVT